MALATYTPQRCKFNRRGLFNRNSRLRLRVLFPVISIVGLPSIPSEFLADANFAPGVCQQRGVVLTRVMKKRGNNWRTIKFLPLSSHCVGILDVSRNSVKLRFSYSFDPHRPSDQGSHSRYWNGIFATMSLIAVDTGVQHWNPIS